MKFLIFLVKSSIRRIKLQTYKSILSTIEWRKNANVKQTNIAKKGKSLSQGQFQKCQKQF